MLKRADKQRIDMELGRFRNFSCSSLCVSNVVGVDTPRSFFLCLFEVIFGAIRDRLPGQVGVVPARLETHSSCRSLGSILLFMSFLAQFWICFTLLRHTQTRFSQGQKFHKVLNNHGVLLAAISATSLLHLHASTHFCESPHPVY